MLTVKLENVSILAEATTDGVNINWGSYNDKELLKSW